MTVKILIIEDEAHIRRLLLQTLETAFEDLIDNEELEIFEAGNGEDGVKIANKEVPIMIFSDIMMPKMNGYEVCETIKKDARFKDTHFVLLTAKGQEVDKAKGLSFGADEYMTKPFNPEEIISKVEIKLNVKRTD